MHKQVKSAISSISLRLNDKWAGKSNIFVQLALLTISFMAWLLAWTAIPEVVGSIPTSDKRLCDAHDSLSCVWVCLIVCMYLQICVCLALIIQVLLHLTLDGVV